MPTERLAHFGLENIRELNLPLQRLLEFGFLKVFFREWLRMSTMNSKQGQKTGVSARFSLAQVGFDYSEKGSRQLTQYDSTA